MHLNWTWQRRIYCLTMAENLIIYSDKQNRREAAGEDGQRQREDMKGESRGEDGEGGQMRRDKKEEISKLMQDVLSCFTTSKHAALPAD